MSAISTIQWTDRTWNPVRGCSVISPGCVNCYAMKQAHRFSSPGWPYEGLTKQTSAGPQWTGAVRTLTSSLGEPLKWKKPVRIFVNSMSDLFHDAVPDEFIKEVFTVMAIAKRHTFQVLTKRPERMRALLSSWGADDMYDFWYAFNDGAREVEAWPLPNVWLGVSVENQKYADERIPLLLQTPAAVRFISAEPLLAPIDLAFWLGPSGEEEASSGTYLDWVIVGGESGSGARPFDLAWARSIVEQCKRADVPVFVKQLGAVPVMDEAEWRQLFDDRTLTPMLSARNHRRAPTGTVPLACPDRKGGDMSEWPADLRIRQFPLGVEASTA